MEMRRHFLDFFFNPLSLQPLKSIVCSFCEERSSQSNHAGKQRPCATQSELSLSCSGALNARSECSITGPEPRACTSTGCTGSTATSLQDGTTVAIPRKEMIMASFHFGTFRLGSREQKLFSILSFRPRQKKEFSNKRRRNFSTFSATLFCEAWAQPLRFHFPQGKTLES